MGTSRGAGSPNSWKTCRMPSVSSGRGETLFSRVSRAGARVLCLGMPATFPPEPVNGLLVAGFDAPVSVGSDARSASDPTLYNAIASKIGPWMTPDLDEGASDGDWRERAAERLPQRVERKKRFALEALDQLARQGGGRVFPYLPESARPGIVAYTATRWGHLLDPKKMPEGEAPPPARDCYRFALSHPAVSLVLCGPSNREQMQEALRALDAGPLDPDEKARMHRIGDHVYGKYKPQFVEKGDERP